MRKNLPMGIKVSRVFYLEPFLIRPERHFIETSLAINKYLSDHYEGRYYLIGNKNLNSELKELIPGVIPCISQTCFESLDDKGQSFYDDLITLHKEYDFQSSDLIIIPTAYENQIFGVSRFTKDIGAERCPLIAIQFHQLFPPTQESDDVSKISFRRQWTKRLRHAFRTINSDKVSYWTTESYRLNRDFRSISQRDVGTLPVPYLISGKRIVREITVSYHPQERVVDLAFLGEGRQEKGLIYLLYAIKHLSKRENRLRFMIQNMGPRGYTNDQEKEFTTLLSEVRRYSNVLVVDGGIPPISFHSLLLNVDGVILPYNPINYHRRVAGMMVHAAIYGIPAIVSSGTWAASALRKKWASGIEFQYDVNNKKVTIANLVRAVEQFCANRTDLSRVAQSVSYNFRRHSTPEEYLNRIITYYEN